MDKPFHNDQYPPQHALSTHLINSPSIHLVNSPYLLTLNTPFLPYQPTLSTHPISPIPPLRSSTPYPLTPPSPPPITPLSPPPTPPLTPPIPPSHLTSSGHPSTINGDTIWTLAHASVCRATAHILFNAQSPPSKPWDREEFLSTWESRTPGITPILCHHPVIPKHPIISHPVIPKHPIILSNNITLSYTLPQYHLTIQPLSYQSTLLTHPPTHHIDPYPTHLIRHPSTRRKSPSRSFPSYHQHTILMHACTLLTHPPTTLIHTIDVGTLPPDESLLLNGIALKIENKNKSVGSASSKNTSESMSSPAYVYVYMPVESMKSSDAQSRLTQLFTIQSKFVFQDLEPYFLDLTGSVGQPKSVTELLLQCNNCRMLDGYYISK